MCFPCKPVALLRLVGSCVRSERPVFCFVKLENNFTSSFTRNPGWRTNYIIGLYGKRPKEAVFCHPTSTPENLNILSEQTKVKGENV